MVRLRPYLAELTRALLVLALILLNLAHQSAPSVASDEAGYTNDVMVNCGFTTPDQMDHAPCHACRVGGDAILPAPPCDAELVDLEVAKIIYSAVNAEPQADFRSVANRSRGPPSHA